MSFQLVPNSVTLDDLERHNSPNRRVISPNSVAFGSSRSLSHLLVSFLLNIFLSFQHYSQSLHQYGKI